MNGDMPHVPITTLAGIASLTDLLNQLPLPSPLPATTAKSLLYNGRISEEVSCLLACRDENLVSQLAHSLNQVSTEHIELKDNLGNDDPEGDMPVLLQTVLSRNPNIFREKSIMQQPMMPQYKMSQNPVHGSPASNYQQTTVSHSPSSHFASPQSASGTRFVPQQNSPVPSPYTPQSPANYMQFNHPPSYSQHQQIQQVASPVVSGGVRTMHDNKVSGQLSNNSSNHNARPGSNEDYMNMVHRLGNEESDPSMGAASFPVRSPQSVCSPVGSEGAAKTGSRPLILQSPPPDISPHDVASDLLLISDDHRKKQKKLSKEQNEQMDKDTLYDIVSSPSKDSAKLTLKLSRVKSSEMNQSEDVPPRADDGSDQDTDLLNNNQLSRTAQDTSHRLGAGEQAGYLQVSGRPNIKQTGVISGVVYDDAEMDALAEIERIERESASERERCSKEVQDKDKPLKKRKQDSYPQEPGAGGTAGASGGPSVGGGNAGSKLTPQEASAASNGASRPALMVSIDLKQAGRGKGQPKVALEALHLNEDQLRQLKLKKDGDRVKDVESRPGIIQQHTDNSRKPNSDGRPEALKHKQENRRDSKHRHDGKPDNSKGHSDGRGTNTPRQKHEGRSDSGHREGGTETPRQKRERRSDSGHRDGGTETPRQKHEGSSDSGHRDGGTDTSRQKHEGSSDSGHRDGGTETPRQKHKGSSDSGHRDGGTETPRQKHEGSSDSGHRDGGTETPRQKHEGSSDSGHRDGGTETPRQKREGRSNSGHRDGGTKTPRQKREGRSNSGHRDGGTETPRQKHEGSSDSGHRDGGTETPRQKHEGSSDSGHRDGGTETPRQKHKGSSDSGHRDGGTETPRQKHEGRSNSGHREGGTETPRQKHEGRSNSGHRDGGTETPRQKHKGSSDSGHRDGGTETPRQKREGSSDSGHRDGGTETPRQKHEGSGTETPRQKHKGSGTETPRQKHEGSGTETPRQKHEGSGTETPRQKHEGSGTNTPRQKHEGSGTNTPRQKHEGSSDSGHREGGTDTPRQKHEGSSDSGHRDGGTDTPRQKHEGSSDSGHREEKYRDSDQSRIRHPDTPKSSKKAERDSKCGQDGDRVRNKDRDKERKHRTESGEHRNKHSPDQRTKPDSPRVKQETRGSTDPTGRHRSDCSSVQNPRRKEERQCGDGGRSHQDGNKRQSLEGKPGEFPAYLLGGKTGSFKNFVIPKLKRDGKDKDLQVGSKLMEGWSEPRVTLQRVSLAENFDKGAKPVVVLQKLTVDEVKKIIREREDRNAHSSNSKSKAPPHLLAEIDSTMPLYEKVKMNKRRHSAVTQKPKYAETDSDDSDDSVNESARKRHKKERDRGWQPEEKKSSRRSREVRHRERSSSDSEEGSPPPSMSDVAKKMRMKEKKRKAYEPKLTPEEMMDSSTFKRFTASVDNILESLEDVDFTATDDDEIPEEILLGKQQLSELGSESAKIKAMGIHNRLPSGKLVKILNILEKNIRDGAKLCTLMNHDNDMDEERLWRELIMERVTKSADACLTALNIMTSPRMPKAVYIEDVIERVLQYTKFHLQNTLYPQYDLVYRVDPHGGRMSHSKSKRAKCSTHKQRVIVMLYNKMCDIVSGISELLKIQLLTDTTILQVSSMGITPFFVENVSELQLCAITLVTAVFSRYEKHRQLVLEELFTSLARLPTSKRSLRNFRLNSCDADGEPLYIQMVTALVLQLIQCVVRLPSGKDMEDEHDKKVDHDVLITNAYETAMRTAQNFLTVFLKKCGSKQGDEDYRPLFENFVHDLLSTVNKPEWPAAELLLSLLGRLLVHQFSNKQTEMALRVASLDYLGTVASRLRKEAVTSKMDQKVIDGILKEATGNDETQQLQKVLLDYLNMDTDTSLVFARKFYIAQWFRDTTTETEKAMKSRNQKDEDSSGGQDHVKDVASTGEIMQRAEARKKFLRKIIKTSPSHFNTLRMHSDTVDYEDACLIVRYLASMRPFAQSFDIYLTQILRVLGESAIAVRTKAMKCLSEVVAVDPSILSRSDMQRGVHGRLMDNSTSVREAAVELLGRFVLSRPQLTEQYYDMLIERILDTGISVRKRVIKILRDICLEQPSFHKVTEMCVKMIRRVNDEEGIKKLVNETFQKLWFTPTPSHDKDAMTRKILNITDVVSACKDSGYDWFEQLLQNLLKSEQDASYKPARKACVQLVDNLVEHMLKYEESPEDCENKGVHSDRLVACITTLHLFSKIRPLLMVKHAMTMQPYLTTKCNTQNDFMVICNVAKILELVVPLTEHPSETFLTTIEEDLMKLIIKYGMTVVQHSVSCLGAVVNKVTHNFKFVWACFNRYYGALTKLKTQLQEDPSSPALAANKPALLRSLFTVGALCRHFDFDQEEFKGTSKVVIKDKVLELLLYFTTHEDEEVQIKAMIGLGFQFIMHPELMFVPDVKTLYNGALSDEKASVNLKIQVLKNLQTYLQEEDSRMQEADREWKKLAKQEDLKEMGDISSGMSSSIMQIYLKQVLEAFFHTHSNVRHFALSVIVLTLNQGLVHPVQCVPYLIAVGTDPEPAMRNKADQQLVEIDKKYIGFIHMKAVAGMKMSYQVQQAIVGSRDAVIRGYRQDETNSSLCSHLFSMVRGNRQHRRAFLISLLNLFDDSCKTEVNMLLFIADNMACFPFQSQDEPLFIMHHIDITLSVSGSNLLQSFKECLRKEPIRQEKKKPRRERKYCSEDEDKEDEQNSSTSSSSDEDDDEVVRRPKKPLQPVDSDSDLDSDVDDVDKVMNHLPENPSPLIEFANASQGILLLLVLKQHLKRLYGFSDSKIQKYSPTEPAKVYDKAVTRKSNVHFNPRQTLDFLSSNLASSDLSYEIKRTIVKQYLDFKVLMEHLDPEEEDDEGGEASANARNKAISSLLGTPAVRNHNHHRRAAPAETDDEDSDYEQPREQRRPKKRGDSAEASGHMNERVEARDVIAICCPKRKDRPQIARVIQKTRNGYSIHWMAGSYSGSWAEAKKRDGRKSVPWVDTIKESEIIYKKIALTSGHKLSNRVVQTLRALYAAKEGTTR
ncbi:nipped-B-like protein B [Diretmus argenteus]